MTAMTIGDLVGFIRADNSDFERGLVRSQLAMEGFRVGLNGQLMNLEHEFVDSGEVMERALTGVGDEMGDVAHQTVVYSSVIDAELRTMAGRFRAVARAADRMGDSIATRLGRVMVGLRGININTDRLGSIGSRFGAALLPLGKFAAMLGTAVPAVSGLVGMLAQIAPAAGLAVTGLIAMQLATKALKIGMQGMGDAVKAAMDPSDPAAFEEAIKNLAPSAQAFAREVKTLQPEFKALQQSVQQRLFQGLDVVLRDMGRYTLPILRNGLTNAAGALNLMGKNLGNTAVGLSKSGVLGRAISGANTGLYNLSRLPSQIVLGLTQVGAAAAPAFGRLTAAAGAGADTLSEKISKAFASGAMEGAINQAITVIKELGAVGGNVFSIFGSIFGAAQASGGGFLGVLQQITKSLATAFASPAVQSGLKAIFQTMAVVGQTVGPLLVMALQAIAPVFAALGPPVQRLITMLGKALEPVIKALGPVLAAAAVAVGALLDAVSPLLPVIGALIAQLLPALTPLLGLVADIFKQLAPLVAQAAQVLMSALQPVLAALIPVIQPIVDALMVLVKAVLPILSAMTAAFAPIIAQLAGTFALLLVALAPVIAQLIVLVADVLTRMMPILIPIIDLVAKLAAVFGDELAAIVRDVLVPALQMITAFLQGDFSGAWNAAKAMVHGIIDAWIREFRDLPARAYQALGGLAGALWSRIQEAGGRMLDGIKQKRAEAAEHIRALPGMAANALGDLGGVLWNAGARLIQGFIDGIRTQFGRVRSVLSSLTSMLPDWKGPAALDARILTPAGRSLIEGFRRGITSATPGLQQQLGGLTGALPGMALGSTGAASGPGGGASPRLIVELAGPQEMKALIRQIVQRDGGDVQRVLGQPI